MKQKRFLVVLAVDLAVATLIGLPTSPNATAKMLGNGISVDCNPVASGSPDVSCVFGGCPRVDGDYVVDAIHIGAYFPQQVELPFKCINGATATQIFKNAKSPMYMEIQACRKVTIGHDKCNEWESFGYTPPAIGPGQPPAGQPPVAPKPPVGQPPAAPMPPQPGNNTPPAPIK